MQVGYIYFTVVEDSITSFDLHCKGWISVFLDPDRPCFLGSCTTVLNDMLVQQTRWSFGLMQMGLSKYCPFIYGPLRMSILHRLCYAALAFDALYVVPFYGLAIIPPICLIYGIPLYPKASTSRIKLITCFVSAYVLIQEHSIKAHFAYFGFSHLASDALLTLTSFHCFLGLRSLFHCIRFHLSVVTTQACARGLVLCRCFHYGCGLRNEGLDDEVRILLLLCTIECHIGQA